MRHLETKIWKNEHKTLKNYRSDVLALVSKLTLNYLHLPQLKSLSRNIFVQKPPSLLWCESLTQANYQFYDFDCNWNIFAQVPNLISSQKLHTLTVRIHHSIISQYAYYVVFFFTLFFIFHNLLIHLFCL